MPPENTYFIDEIEYPAVWEAHPGPQWQFLRESAYEALYGGAAGGGKSDALLAAAMRETDHPRYQALLLRRTFPELQKTLIARSELLYPCAGGVYHSSERVWRFPSGARIYFGYLDTDADRLQYQGAEFQFIGWDELTHFSQVQYEYLLSRARSAEGLPVRIRAATNPGGPGHDWVQARWGPWLNPDAPVQAAPGECLYYRPKPDGTVSDREEWVPPGTPAALTRIFIPARLTDNPTLCQYDPAYRQRLDALDPVTRAQLRDGNWLVKPAAGLYFKRWWFSYVDVPPAEVIGRVRYWDLAASPKGDWTVGVKLSRTKAGVLTVEDVVRLQGSPGEVQALVRSTAEGDGHDVPICIEQDPGQAGKDQIHHYVTQQLAGWEVRGRPKYTDKVKAASTMAAQAEVQNIRLVRGRWNGPFLDVLEAFPEGQHDDDVDALSGAGAVLLELRTGRVLPAQPPPPTARNGF